MHDDIVDLQTRLAFQDGLLEELNSVVTSQQQQIERLENTVKALKTQMENMQQTQVVQQGSEPPPPHY
jgi:SlyX protein